MPQDPIAIRIAGTKQRRAGFAPIFSYGILPAEEADNMDKMTSVQEKPVFVLRHTSDYLLYMIVDNQVKAFDTDTTGVLSIALKISRDIQFANNVSPYDVLMDIYNTFRQKYMKQLPDGCDKFVDMQVNDEDFYDILRKYGNIEQVKRRMCVMNPNGRIGTLNVPKRCMQLFFRDTQFAEFCNFREIEIGNECETSPQLKDIKIPEPDIFKFGTPPVDPREQAKDAWQNILDQENSGMSADSLIPLIEKYINDFPDADNIHDAKQKLDGLNYRKKITAIQTAWQSIVEKEINGEPVDELIALINNYINVYPDADNMDVAKNKLLELYQRKQNQPDIFKKVNQPVNTGGTDGNEKAKEQPQKAPDKKTKKARNAWEKILNEENKGAKTSVMISLIRKYLNDYPEAENFDSASAKLNRLIFKQEEEERSKRNKIIFFLTGLLAAALVVVGIFLFCGKRGDEPTQLVDKSGKKDNAAKVEEDSASYESEPNDSSSAEERIREQDRTALSKNPNDGVEGHVDIKPEGPTPESTTPASPAGKDNTKTTAPQKSKDDDTKYADKKEKEGDETSKEQQNKKRNKELENIIKALLNPTGDKTPPSYTQSLFKGDEETITKAFLKKQKIIEKYKEEDHHELNTMADLKWYILKSN